MQRKYERNIRATKDRLVGYIESDDDLATAYAVRLKTLERGYKEFSRAAGLPTQQDRLQQFGFGRSVSAKAVWENRRAGAPKTIRAENVTLQSTIEVNFGNVRGVIPMGVELTNVRVIAGYGTSTKIRVADSLVEEFGGKRLRWEKKGGIIKTDNFQYDVHWYEYKGIQYRTRLKGMKPI